MKIVKNLKCKLKILLIFMQKSLKKNLLIMNVFVSKIHFVHI